MTATDALSTTPSSAVVVSGQELRHLRDGAEAYPAMLAAIAAARREIVLEMYWFGSDAIGRAFVDALSERAREGTIVHVIYDAVGSSPVDDAMFDDLRKAGGDVRAYHPFVAFRRAALARFSLRDHRKLLVCDGEVGFTGGLNIGLPWAPRDQNGEGWRDDMVEVHGAAAGELRALFYQTWRRLLRRRERREPKKLPADATAPLAKHPTGDVWVLANGSWPTRRAIRSTYVRWIRGATKAIDIVNAYFVPDWGLRRALVRAVRQGIQVRVLVPKDGDVRIVQWAVEATLERLVKQGVKAFAYQGAILHAKTAVVDDQLVTIGSYNLDHRSLRYNLEVNLAVHDATFASSVRSNIDRDIVERSVPWTLETLRARGFFRRLLGEFALLFARFL